MACTLVATSGDYHAQARADSGNGIVESFESSTPPRAFVNFLLMSASTFTLHVGGSVTQEQSMLEDDRVISREISRDQDHNN